MAKSPWLGLLGIAGGLAYLAIPHSETYSDYGLGINSVDIECGNSFDSKVDVHFENPDEHTAKINVVPETLNLDFEHFLSNSFGFGGTNSSLIVKKWK